VSFYKAHRRIARRRIVRGQHGESGNVLSLRFARVTGGVIEM